VGSANEGPAVLKRLLGALNDHDLDEVVSCFASDYVNETPAHPLRSFCGNTQVRANWTQIFASVPDVTARILDLKVDGDRVWTEWNISGTRLDGAPFLMRGVVIFGIAAGSIASARFYLEPVEDTSGDVNAHTGRVTGAGSPHPIPSPVVAGGRSYS
jgi:ketosteroid isomerase-like protein